MARIPDFTALGGRTAPVTSRPIVVDQAGEIDANTIGRAAESIGNMAAVYTERQDKLKYAEAKSALLTADVAARKSLENDQNWETHESRYSEMMAKAREKAAGLIRNKSDRALFDMDAKLDVERGMGSIRDGARRIEVDMGRATLESVLSANRTAALEAKDEPTRAALLQATQDAIAGARDKGYVSAQDALATGQKWTRDYAEAFVGMKPAAERIALLDKSGIADHIPPDRRKALKDAALAEGKELRIRSESQAKADKLVGMGDMGAALEAARKIEDPELRDATTIRIKGYFADIDASKRLAANNLFDDVMDRIEQGATRDAIPAAEWLALEPSHREAIERRLKDKTEGRKPETNWTVYYSLRNSAASPDPKDREDFANKLNLMVHRNDLSDAQFESLTDLQMKMREGKADVELAGIRTQNDVVDGALNQLGIKRGQSASKEQNARAEKFEIMADERVRALQAETGKKATPDQVQQIVNALTTEVAINRPLWFDTKKPVFDLTLDDIPAADRADIERALRSAGKPVNDQTILDLYSIANRK